MRVTEADLLPGETVYVKRHMSGSLCLLAKRAGQDYTVLREDGHVCLFNGTGEITAFCLKRRLTWRRRGLVLFEEGRFVPKKEREFLSAPNREGVTDADLRRGETVYLRRNGEGNLYLLVKRAGMEYPVFRFPDDGHVRIFDSPWEAWSYCQMGGFDLQEWEKPVPQGERRLLPTPKDEEPLPLLDPKVEKEIRQVVGGAIRRQASWDLEELAFLINEREHRRAELEAELRRRKALGNRSCLCRTCRHGLESPLREVQEEIDRIWAWWATSLGTTPADVTADRWP